MNHAYIIQTLDNITNHCLARNANIEDYLLQSAKILTSHLQLEDFVIYFNQNSKRKLKQFVKVNNIEGPFLSDKQPYTVDSGTGIVGSCAKLKKPILVKDTTKNANYISEDVFRYSELVVPIIYNNSVIGVLDSEHSNKNFYTSDFLHVFGLMAKLISYFLNESKFKSREEVEQKYFYFFKTQLENHKIYLNEGLSSKDVADMLDISSSYFSQIVNKVSGMSFNSIVNSYRIKHIIDLLYQDEHKKRSLLSIAMSSGFNSKSSFNLNFKKITSKSPSEFITDMS